MKRIALQHRPESENFEIPVVGNVPLFDLVLHKYHGTQIKPKIRVRVQTALSPTRSILRPC